MFRTTSILWQNTKKDSYGIDKETLNHVKDALTDVCKDYKNLTPEKKQECDYYLYDIDCAMGGLNCK